MAKIKVANPVFELDGRDDANHLALHKEQLILACLGTA
jgi:hypothetical protein